jgi:hypothetical protein
VRILRFVDVQQFTAAHPAWRAVFDDDSLVRVVAWAVVGDEARIVGFVVDPTDPSRVIAAPEARTAEGAGFLRYGFRLDSATSS